MNLVEGFEIATSKVTNKKAVIIPFHIRGIYSYATSKYKKGDIKDISIFFGKPMPISSTAKEVKESVLNLSVDNFEEYSKEITNSRQKLHLGRAKFVGR